MKRNMLCIAVLLSLLMVFNQCKKEEEDLNPVNDKVEKDLDAKFADKDDEAVKADLEQSGLEFSDKMEVLVDEEAIEVSANLMNLLFNSSVEKNTIALAPLKALKSMETGNTSSNNIERLLMPFSEEETVSIMDEWLEVTGVYEYNFDTDDFDYTSGGEEVIVKFPGAESDQANTAEIKIYDFKVKEITNPHEALEDLETSDVPTSIKMSLKYNGTEIMSYSYSASFQNNGIPTSAETSVTLGIHTLSSEITHSPYTAATGKLTFKQNDEVLIEAFQGASGDWSEENIDENTVVYSDEWGEWEEVDAENILESANAYFQVLNIRIAAKIDINKFVPEAEALDEKYYGDDWNELSESQEQAYYNELAALVNEHADMVVVNTKTKEKLAKAEAAVKLYTYTDEWCEYDWDTGEYTSCEDQYYDLAVNMVFSDGSKIDAETYFSEGFDDVITAFENMLKDLEEMVN